MKLRMTLLAALVALVPLAAPGPAPAAAKPGGGRPAEVEVFATGLVYPRGLDFGPGGRLYVAEAGPGGDTVTPGTCPRVHLAVRALPQRPHRPDLPDRPGRPPHHRGRRAAVGP
jgi:hypothetical protein